MENLHPNYHPPPINRSDGRPEGGVQKALTFTKWVGEDIRAQAYLPTVRFHDLRHAFASPLASGDMTVPMFGKLLGHMQVQTTQRCAHLLDDPLRARLEQIGNALKRKLLDAS